MTSITKNQFWPHSLGNDSSVKIPWFHGDKDFNVLVEAFSFLNFMKAKPNMTK